MNSDDPPGSAKPPPHATPPTRPLSVPGSEAARLLRLEEERPPERIGPYRIIGPLGKGGMGIVYLAEQERPIRRRVAIKLIQSQVDSRQVLARFEAERQALGRLNHPHIAQVYDAGTSEGGRPYFVMEYVDGVPFLAHCDRHRLSLPRRLEILILICDALHYAHQQGIVHRDVKPSNILVTLVNGAPHPKLIDFGLAKATGLRLTDTSQVTRVGQIVGTPSYMSPEQAGLSEAAIDGGTDIYSLGVVLYELLTGSLPFDAEKVLARGYGELQRVIREVDPPRPSQRLLASGQALVRLAERRDSEAQSLPRLVRGDLDWITMRALEKSRSRRYASAAEMAEDLRRHLRSEPVLAGPPSLSYRTGKLIRRRPMHTTLAVVLAVLLPAGAWLGLRALSQQRRLTAARIETLERDLDRAGIDPELLDRAAGAILALDPGHVMARRALAVASFNRSLRFDRGDPESARLLSRALDLTDGLARDLPGRAWPALMKAHFLESSGRSEEAGRLRQGLASSDSRSTDDDFFEARLILEGHPTPEESRRAEALLDRVLLKVQRSGAIELRGLARAEQGDWDGALDDFRLATLLNPRDPFPQLKMGRALTFKNRFQEAEDRLRQADDLAASAGWRPDQRWEIENNRAYNFIQWGSTLEADGRRSEALERSRNAEQQARAGLALEPDEPILRLNLGRSLRDQYHLSQDKDRRVIEAAVAEFQEARSLALKRDSPENRRDAVLALSGVCDAYLEAGDPIAAMPHCRMAAELTPQNPVAFYNLAGALALSGRKDEALEALAKDVALGDRDSTYLRDDAWFRSLRSDPRFRELLRRMETGG